MGWAGQEGLASPMPRTRALAEVSQYPVCSFTTPVGEESRIVPGYPLPLDMAEVTHFPRNYIISSYEGDGLTVFC